LAAMSNGDVVAAGFRTKGRGSIAPQGIFTVQKLDGATGALMVCGDGYVDPGEECDLGSQLNSDFGCCSSTCRRHLAKHAPCFDCAQSLPFRCKMPISPNDAVLRLGNRHGARRDALQWQWGSGAATSKAEFGAPRRSTAYALCLYENVSDGVAPSDSAAPVILHAAAPAGGFCRPANGCWQSTTKGFQYRSASGGPDGLRFIELRAGADGQARIRVAEGGRHVTIPQLPLTTPVVAQIRKVDGSGPCWSASHGVAVRNDPRRFVARGN
jgi:cysteine-rich repeat protein